MKKTLKITLISLASLLGLILLTLLIVCWLVLTPARLTSIVRSQAPNFITCDFNIERADLTVVKTFPEIGLKINDVVLVNPMVGSPSDTLAYIDECVVTVDIKKFLKENLILVDECRLNGGYVNLFTDEKGVSNLDIFPPSEPDTVEESSEMTYGIDLAMLRLSNVDVSYTDLTQGMLADIEGMTMSVKAKMKGDALAGNVVMSLNGLDYNQTTDSSAMQVKLNDLKIEGDAEMIGDNVKADIKASSSFLNYESGGQYAEFNNFNFKYDGDVNNYDVVKGNLEVSLDDLSFVMDDETFVDKADIRLITPLDATLSTMNVKLGASQFAFNNIFIDIIGDVAMPDDDIVADLNIKTNTLIIEELIELIPASMREELLDGIDVKGELQLTADVEGTYNENSMPAVNAEIKYNKGMVSMPEMLPYPVTNFNTHIKADIDLNNKSDVYVNYLKANMSNSSFAVSGTIKDVMDKMYCNIKLNATANLDELQSFIPEDIVAEGVVRLDATAVVNNHQITNMDLTNAKINGNMQWENMNIVYCDTINVAADKLNVSLSIPTHTESSSSDMPEQELAVSTSNSMTNFANVTISGSNFDARVADMIVANLKDYNIAAQVSNILDENIPMSVYADYDFSRIDASMDDMNFVTNNPHGSLAMFMKEGSNDATYIAAYSGDSLSFTMGEEMSFDTESLEFNVSADYDDDQEDMLLQWSPHAGIKLNKAVFAMSDIPTPVYIPSIDFKYDSTGIEIQNSSIILGNSDFELQGKFTDVDEFIRKEALLKGELDFTSHYTDVNQIMEMFSGMGDTTVVAEDVAFVDTVKKEDDPFIVPLGVDVTLNTKIDKAVAGKMNLKNIGGGLTVKNGVLVLNEMGFTSDAATMELTAMYKSPRKNHLYVGFALHLIEIDIAEMINIIPELDTLVPMLSSFAGRAEFHIAAETYLKSNYELKTSTLRGATAIHGKDLVILDNATYKKLGRLLGFKDKEHNKIDNLGVEITAFRNEIDVYPTLITVDKYQAVVGGRHNLNMTFDYRLGMTNPWLFRRLGIVITGNMDDMKFKLKGKKNIGLEEPKGKAEDVYVIQETLRLKNLIYESIK